MTRAALFVSTALIANLGCGGRESGTSVSASMDASTVGDAVGPDAPAPLPLAPVACLTQDQASQNLLPSFGCDFGGACALDGDGGLTCLDAGPPGEACIVRNGAQAWCESGCRCADQYLNEAGACICGALVDAGRDSASDASCDVSIPSTLANCPSVAAACPCGCVAAAQPQLYDRTRGCLEPPSPDVTICNSTGANGATLTCWARIDTGDLYWLGGEPWEVLNASGSLWRECTPAESSLVFGDSGEGTGAPPCPPKPDTMNLDGGR